MKQWVNIIPVLLLFTFVFDVSPAFAQKTLKLSVPPSIWAQVEGDKMIGPIIDFLTDYFAEFDIEIVSVQLPWARAIANMESGQLDLIPVVFQTQERERTMVFSVPYVAVPTVVYVAKGSAFPFGQPADLVGLRGLIIRNDSISPEFEKIREKLDITVVNDYETIFKMLSSGRADYAVSAKYAYLVEARKHGWEDSIEELPIPIASRNLHIALSRKSEFINYLPGINERLLRMQADGTMQRIVENVLERAAGL